MQNKDLVLGIDTSNYKTSLAFTSANGAILMDSRKPLVVKQGERGLRQSHALFQHMENFPAMILDIFHQIDKNRIGAISVSSRPRPIEGSYMPVFKAGVNYGSVLAASLGVPIFEFSHQEGHLEAVKHETSMSEEKEFLAYHLSGGTCELLYVKGNCFEIIGGSRDISFGQVLDRIGVSLNMTFPAGENLDMLATKSEEDYGEHGNLNMNKPLLKKIPIDGLYINLSGIETQCQREIIQNNHVEGLIYELFVKISECLCLLTEKAILETGCHKILFTGGVAASTFIRNKIRSYFDCKPVKVEFGNPHMATDNAVGVSLLGGKLLWR